MPDSDQIERGDFYEDCRYHPVLCVSADYSEDELEGISLVDGTIGWCSPTNCGVVPLTVDQAIDRAVDWDAFAVARGLPVRPIRPGLQQTE